MMSSDFKVTSGTGRALVPPAVSLLAPIFGTDPIMTYLLNNLTTEQRLAYLPKYFHSLLTAAAMNNATFFEIDGWKSCIVSMPPGSDVANPLTMLPAGLLQVLWTLGISGCRKMLGEWPAIVDPIKKRETGNGDTFYYLFFMGTMETERRRGMASALINELKVIAAKDNKPIWLESTTEKSRKLYAELGFEDLGSQKLGKGKVGPDGYRKKDGEGVPLWLMVWRPDNVG